MNWLAFHFLILLNGTSVPLYQAGLHNAVAYVMQQPTAAERIRTWKQLEEATPTRLRYIP